MSDPAIQAWHREDELRTELRRLRIAFEEIGKALQWERHKNQELLEALKGVLVWGTDEDWKNAKIWCEKARAAIAKAEGEQK